MNLTLLDAKIEQARRNRVVISQKVLAKQFPLLQVCLNLEDRHSSEEIKQLKNQKYPNWKGANAEFKAGMI